MESGLAGSLLLFGERSKIGFLAGMPLMVLLVSTASGAAAGMYGSGIRQFRQAGSLPHSLGGLPADSANCRLTGCRGGSKMNRYSHFH